MDKEFGEDTLAIDTPHFLSPPLFLVQKREQEKVGMWKALGTPTPGTTTLVDLMAGPTFGVAMRVSQEITDWQIFRRRGGWLLTYGSELVLEKH